jgi:hypothetical protein
MDDHRFRNRAAWVMRLSNHKLIRELAALDTDDRSPGLLRRMDIVYDEINRRERAGTPLGKWPGASFYREHARGANGGGMSNSPDPTRGAASRPSTDCTVVCGWSVLSMAEKPHRLGVRRRCWPNRSGCSPGANPRDWRINWPCAYAAASSSRKGSNTRWTTLVPMPSV